MLHGEKKAMCEREQNKTVWEGESLSLKHRQLEVGRLAVTVGP